MPKPKAPELTAIGDAEMAAYLESSTASFRFEMRVLRALVDLQFACVHGGTYVDPITQKHREFDIQARRLFPPGDMENWSHELCLSVECKNVSDVSPLLVHCTSRTEDEAFHQLIEKTGMYPVTRRFQGGSSAYREKQPVGKRTDQVMLRDGEFVRGGDDFFEKTLQAVNGARGLIETAATVARDTATRKGTLRAIVPVLVVPDETLWAVNYDEDGSQVSNAAKVPRVSRALGITWTVLGSGGLQCDYTMSHLEFVTVGGLWTLVESLRGSQGLYQSAELSS